MATIWVRRWWALAKPGLTAGAATSGPTQLRRPSRVNPARACSRSASLSCRAISASDTDRATPRDDEFGASVVRHAADGAAGLAPDTHFGELHGAAIQHQQTAGQRSAGTAEQLERFGGLQGADDAHQGCENAHSGAAGFFKRGVGRKNAGVAGRVGIARVIDTD